MTRLGGVFALRVVLSLALSLTSVSTTAQTVSDRDSHRTDATSEAASNEAQVLSPFIVSYANGRLTLVAEKHSLAHILEAIAVKADFSVFGAEAFRDSLLSVRYEHAPLDAALRELLAKIDAFYQYVSAGESAARLRAVWVYPSGGSLDIVPERFEAWASTREFEAQLSDPTPSVRARALAALADRRRDEGAVDIVMAALLDPADEVRMMAFSAALQAGIEIPQDRLVSLASGDPAAGVRLLALQAIDQGPNAKDVASTLVGDPDPDVRGLAEAMLNAKPPSNASQTIRNEGRRKSGGT